MNATSPPSRWIMEQATYWPDDASLLDFASGNGRHSRALAALYPGRFRILAVDRDADALVELAAACPDARTCICDLEANAAWPFAAQKFDVVLVTNYLYRPRLDALFNLVADNGYLAYETFARGNAAFGRPGNPDYLLMPGEMLSVMPAGFTRLDYFHGKTDQPKPAMIQRLAARRTA